MSYQCAETTRQKLADAVRALIRQRGMDAVTVREVCRVSGISNGSFYHHFKSKEDLIRHACLETDQWLTEELVRDCERRPPLEGLMHLLERYMHFVEAELGARVKEYFLLMMKDGVSAAFRPERPYVQEITRQLVRCRSAGLISGHRELNQMALFAVRFVQGCILNWCVEGARGSLTEAFRQVEGLFLHGICGAAQP